ncbi:MAG: YeeE/YedE family protein [Spirochaetales bacterium]|nr:YeeE/YedE family protein [Spirochaetales bacterium]
MSDTTENTPATGTTGGIRRSSSSRASKKPKKSTIPYGILLALVIGGIGVALGTVNFTLGFFWFTGMAFGFILQKTRFCFTASLRDPYLTGSTSLTKAVLTALAITSLGFWAIMYSAHAKGLPIPGQGFVVPFGVHTMVGAFIFGIGMVISGGCASGTLMRVGEGFLMQILSLTFFIVGSVLSAATFGWWQLNFINQSPKVFLPDVLGWFGAIVVQLLIIGFLWIAADKYGKAKGASDAH